MPYLREQDAKGAAVCPSLLLQRFATSSRSSTALVRETQS